MMVSRPSMHASSMAVEPLASWRAVFAPASSRICTTPCHGRGDHRNACALRLVSCPTR